MASISSLDLAIALGGVGVGLAVGSLNNMRKTGSLFKAVNYSDIFSDSSEKPINDETEKVSFIVRHLELGREKRSGELSGNPLIPSLWNPAMPLEHLLPLALVGISQLFIAARSPGATVNSIAILGATYTFKAIVLPVTYSFAIFQVGSLVRIIFCPVTEKMGIDASGHALVQLTAAIYKVFTFYALSNMGISSNLYRVTASVTALSDYMWTYRTASSHHSVMDMGVAVLFMGISFGAVYKTHCALATCVPRVFCQLVGRIYCHSFFRALM